MNVDCIRAGIPQLCTQGLLLVLIAGHCCLNWSKPLKLRRDDETSDTTKTAALLAVQEAQARLSIPTEGLVRVLGRAANGHASRHG